MILSFMIFQACSSAEQTYNFGGKEEATDATISFGESDADIIFDTPVFTIPPYTEKQHCYFLTYEGPDVAVVAANCKEGLDSAKLSTRSSATSTHSCSVLSSSVGSL